MHKTCSHVGISQQIPPYVHLIIARVRVTCKPSKYLTKQAKCLKFENWTSQNLFLISHLLARSSYFSSLARIHSLCIDVLIRFVLVTFFWDMLFIFLVMFDWLQTFFGKLDWYELLTYKVCYLINLRKWVSLFVPCNLRAGSLILSWPKQCLN